MPRKPTINSDSVAQDQIRAFIDRILRMREEAKAIKDDIKEIYAEAAGNGFDKTVLGSAVLRVEKRAKNSNFDAEQMEADALLDLYLSAYFGTEPSRTHAHAREDRGEELTSDASNSGALADRSGQEEINTNSASDTPAADEGEGTVAPGSLANQPSGNSEEFEPVHPDRNPVGVGAVGGEGHALSANHIPDVGKMVDATNSAIEHHAPDGAGTDDRGGIGEGVAPAALANPIQPSESTATQSTAARMDVPVVGQADTPDDPSNRGGTAGSQAPPVDTNSEPGDGQGGALGFEPGSIRYESTPPVGIVRHEFQRCFPEPLGRNIKLLDDIRANGVREPILMQGNILLDGWSRFLAARELHIDYPVKEYDGTDPLADIIKLNMASRSLNLAERVSIGRKLIKLAPEREGDIVELLDLEQQKEAAQ